MFHDAAFHVGDGADGEVRDLAHQFGPGRVPFLQNAGAFRVDEHATKSDAVPDAQRSGGNVPACQDREQGHPVLPIL